MTAYLLSSSINTYVKVEEIASYNCLNIVISCYSLKYRLNYIIKYVNYLFVPLMTKPNNIEVLCESADLATALMKVLANPDRLLLLCQLSQGKKSVGELDVLTGIQQPTLSKQLTVLREYKVVETRREGKNIYYSVTSKPALAFINVMAEQLCKLNQ
ncbi:MAG: DNA-binding transcriptional ArsR family regulator [Methylophilaceae bacterium]|jgi:DNA-binding transcriptional ArsR family regulator